MKKYIYGMRLRGCSIGAQPDGFCYLDFFDEDDKRRLVACVSTDEIKYLRFVEVEE
ncbi:MAG: hypothetical protein E6Z20_08295 [Finegoldia magna]|nr:hypothetical protein [Finegoldia magna]